MPQINVRIHVVTQAFEDGNRSRLGEALFFPEVSCLDDDSVGVRNLVVENAMALLAHLPNDELWRRMPDAVPEVIDVKVVIEPAERNRLWNEPVTLELPAIRWQQGLETAIVCIPSLGIEVLSNDADDLPRLVEDQVRMALFRAKTSRSLRTMAMQARCRSVSVDSTVIEHFVIPPVQQALNEKEPDITFNPLSHAAIVKITENELRHIAAREGLTKLGIQLSWTPDVVDHLARAGSDPRY